jgi:hypothetical protein
MEERMAGRVKLYDSQTWMRDRFLVKRMTPEDIAKEAGCSLITVYRKLREFGYMK